MHFPDASAFCCACRMRREVCLCATAQRTESDVRLLVILHGVEALKMSNTGHFASLVIPDCKVLTHGSRGRAPANLSELKETHAADGRPWRDILFFPGLGATPMTPELAASLRTPEDGGLLPRLRVIIPDGTWSQARRMVKRLPELAALPRYLLPPTPELNSREAMRPRGNPAPGRVSTLEAIATAFGALGDEASQRALFAVYDAAALRIALMRGKMRLEGHRHVLADASVEMTSALPQRFRGVTGGEP